MKTYYKVVYTLDEEFDSIEQARKFRSTLPTHATDVSIKVLQEDE